MATAQQISVENFARHGPKTSFSHGRVAAGLERRARAPQPSHGGHALETQQRRCQRELSPPRTANAAVEPARPPQVPLKMTSLPASQAWLYVRNNSSFLVKRNGVQFSREPGNLTQLNTYKSSGLCNDKAIDINLDEDGKIVMALKAPKRATKPSKSLNKTPLRKNFRRSAKAIQSQTAGKFYRGDLTGKALARYAALHRFTKVQQGLAKKAKTKTGRRGAVGDDDEGMPSLTA
jgi:large subunit ribosomal protein L28e